MLKNNPIPDMTLEEASEFWDEHEFGEYDDVQEVTDVQFALRRKKYVGIDLSLFARISEQAKYLHTTEDRLINAWLQEKVGA